MRDRAPYVVPLAALLAFQLFVMQAWGQQAPGRNLQIVVAEGEGATNNVRSRANKQVVVRVEDDNHRPVVGAAVSFFLPNEGPGGMFMNGTSSLTTTTDGRGRAFAGGINFNQQAGPMEMRITASYAGQMATATVMQTNVVGPVVTGGGSSSSSGGGGGMSTGTKILIIAVIAAGAAAGAILATRGGKSNSSTAPPPTVTITPGTPTVGAP
jgi:hypothetical protein